MYRYFKLNLSDFIFYFLSLKRDSFNILVQNKAIKYSFIILKLLKYRHFTKLFIVLFLLTNIVLHSKLRQIYCVK